MEIQPDFERIALASLLLEAANFYAIAIKIGRAGPLTPVIAELPQTRARLAGLVVSQIEDDDLRRLAIEGPSDETAEMLAAEAADLWAAGPSAIAHACLRREEGLGAVLEDLSQGSLSPDLAMSLQTTLEQTQRQLGRLIATLAAAVKPPEAVLDFATRRSRGAAVPTRRVYDVWYGTNRRPLAGEPASGFSNERDDKVHHGRCGVAIPLSHDIGRDGAGWWRRALGQPRLSLDRIESLAADAFWTQVKRALSKGTEPLDAVVFIHGFNVSFEAAAIRAAQIGADLALPGLTAFFSWPSRGRTLAYPADEASIEASELQITEFLLDFAARSGARRVHLVAHSMGNRGLLRAVDRIASRAAARAKKPFAQIVLAAPDVDRDTFKVHCGAYPHVSERTTLYVSRKDLAVRASLLLHGAPRVGFAPPISVVPGIDTVNASKVDLSLLGHGYFAAARPVLADIHQLFTFAAPPDRRTFVREVPDPRGAYWEIAS